MMVNIYTQETTIPAQIGNEKNPSRATLLADGWRDCGEVLPVADGYERLTQPTWEQDPNDAERAIPTYHDTLIADRLAAEAEAARLATLPAQFATGVAVQDAAGHWLELVPVGDDVVPVQVSNSPLDPDTRDAMRAAGVAAWQAHVDRIAAIKTDLDQVESALDQMDVTTTGALGVAVAATTGVNKTALTEVRKVLVDVKTALKNLRQASEKLRKEVR